MTDQPPGITPRGEGPSRGGHSQELFWHTLGRLLLLYLVPLLLLAIFFHLQYRNLLRDGRQAHLEVIAEHPANTFDLFLRERLVNLDNIIEDPVFSDGGWERRPLELLSSLLQASDAFVDLGVVSGEGDLLAYVGPVEYPGIFMPMLRPRPRGTLGIQSGIS